jgi:hypothetical protein
VLTELFSITATLIIGLDHTPRKRRRNSNPEVPTFICSLSNG